MVTTVRAEAVITAQNRLRPGLAASARELERFRAQQSKATAAFGSMQARALAGIGGVVAGFSATRALNEATKRFAEVDRAMTRTGITGDATADQTRKGTEELRNLARETATLFDPAQKGLDAITASGRDFGEAMKMMPSVLKTAQASGAGVSDIANSSTALLDHMKISVEGLAEAQDTLAMGGKLGKFELKDMARYLPSMLPAFKALGQSGQEGLRNLVATLQVIRSGTGTAEEAAASAQNIFSKMESDETVKNFAKLGVNLPKAMAKARKEGKNLLDVFLELSHQALKGDLSKVPQLFKDQEVQRGMRPLLEGLQKRIELIEKLRGAKGTIDTDFKRVTADAQANLDRFREASDRAKSAFGGLAAEIGSPLIKQGAANLDLVAQAMERAGAAVRDKGVRDALADMAIAAGKQIKTDLDENRENWIRIEDQKTIETIGVSGAAHRRFNDLSKRDPHSLTRAEVAELHILRRRNADKPPALSSNQENAWSRDQVTRLGPLPEPLTNESPEVLAIVESAREARRGRAFTNMHRDNPPSGGRKGNVLPPPRPKDLGGPAMVPFAPLEEAKTKVEQAASSFSLLGPAAQAAGTAAGSGFVAALNTELDRGLSEAAAKVEQFKRLLQFSAAANVTVGVRPAGTGLGGFDTGRQGPN